MNKTNPHFLIDDDDDNIRVKRLLHTRSNSWSQKTTKIVYTINEK